MTKKIFHSILLVAGTVLLASLLVIMGCLYEYFGSVEKKQLRDELELAAVAVEKNGTEYLSQLSSERYRLTWIENDGTVLYDTVTDAESLENHADRVEVKQALEYGEGESTRYSSTLLQKTMYCAEKLTDGSVLRISMSRATAGVLLVGMVQPILVVLIVALILSSVLAKSLSRRIVQPLNKLDLEHPLENDAYEELAPLLGRINRQHLQIDEQMDELQRQQTEFSQITSSMREGLVLLDEKEHVLSINPAAEKLFGTDESCVGQDFLTIDRSHDMSLAIERAMDEGHSEARVERGGRIWQFDVSRIGASGAAVGAVLLAFDITERETAEQTRREFTARLLRCLALGDVESQQHSADRRAACADAADVKLPDTAAALHARLTVPLVHGALDGKAHVVAAVDGQKVLPDAALVRAEELFRRGVDTQHMLFFIEQHKPFAHAACDLRKFRLLALKFVHLLVDLQVLAVDAPEQRGELFIGVIFKRMLKVQLVERLDDAARQALG